MQNLSNVRMMNVQKRVSIDLFDIYAFKHWSNVIIAGGYALDLLKNTTTSSDIDLFIYNANKEQIKNIFTDVLALSKGTIETEFGAVVTIISSKGKKIQLINTSSKKTISQFFSRQSS